MLYYQEKCRLNVYILKKYINIINIVYYIIKNREKNVENANYINYT